MRWPEQCAWSVIGAATLVSTQSLRADETVKLNLIPQGATEKMGGQRAQLLALKAERPAAVRKIPAGLLAPQYGVLSLGDAANPTQITVLLDESGPAPRLFVDSNGDGDLTNDPPAVWEARPYDATRAMRYGGATVQIKTPDGTLKVALTMYRFDKTDDDPRRRALRDKIVYYGDYAREGKITLGGKSYRVLLIDAQSRGDFRGQNSAAIPEASGVEIWIDANDNGVFDRVGERFDAARPFNIAGTTYAIKNMSASGASFQIVKSDKPVAEIAPPLNLSAGKKAVAFTAKTTDGKTIHFPADFRGKLVLLDFWALGSAFCRDAMPDLVKTYNAYHTRNFEIVSVSLDPKDMGDKLNAFTKAAGMAWPQIYDGQYWAAEVAQKYGIEAIPRAFLMDGDTGEILAEGSNLHGAALAGEMKRRVDRRH